MSCGVEGKPDGAVTTLRPNIRDLLPLQSSFQAIGEALTTSNGNELERVDYCLHLFQCRTLQALYLSQMKRVGEQVPGGIAVQWMI